MRGFARRMRGLIVGVVVLAAAGAACRSSSSRADGAASTITILYPGDERVLGPYWEMPAKFLVFLPLVTMGEDGEPQPALARSWEHSDDYRTWTIRLRDDVTWHDGRPVTSHDVKFTLDLFAHPDVLWADKDAYAIEIIDEKTYRIHCRDARTHPLDTWQVYYPKHLLEALPPGQFQQWDFWKSPVGNGPYRYVRHVPQTSIELRASPDYYAGPPAIEQVVLKLSSNTGLTDLMSGQVDASAFLNAQEALKIAQNPRFRVYYGSDGDNFRAIAWNQRHAPLADARVRRAFTLALDRRELLRVVDMPAELPVFDGLFTQRQFRRRELPPPMPFDRARAAALLDEAGWTDDNGDGFRERRGQPLALTVLVSPEEETEAIYLQDALRRVGARVIIDRLELNIVRRRIRSGDFQASIRTFGGGLGGNFGSLKMFGRESVLGYANPEAWRLLERAAGTLDPGAIDDIYRRLYAVFQEDVPMTFLYPATIYVAARDRVAGLSSPFRAEPTVWMSHLRLEDAR